MIERTGPVIRDLGWRNLVVSGCSFTATANTTQATTWPWFLRDAGGFEQVQDLSVAGAGNQHIHHSVIWCLEQQPELTPADTFVAVMWAAYDRDDVIADPAAITDHYAGAQQAYSEHAGLLLTGGSGGTGNGLKDLSGLTESRNLTSRSIDTYIHMRSLEQYLRSRGFHYVFTEHMRPQTYYESGFDPSMYLAPPWTRCDVSAEFLRMTRQVVPQVGNYARTESDGFHLPAAAHKAWVQDVLLPVLAVNPNVV